MLLCSSTMSNGQNGNKYVTLKGDTYTMLVFADWVSPTGVTSNMEPRRFTRYNFEATSYHRLPPLSLKGDRCGSVLKITEFKGCHSCLDIMRKDSISELSLATDIVCMPVNEGNIKYTMSVVIKSTQHPETKEWETLRFYNWYIPVSYTHLPPAEGLRTLEESGAADACALVTDSWSEIAEFIRRGERRAEIRRETRETQITVRLDLDGRGDFNGQISTGLRFLDHMLAQIAHHGGVALAVDARGLSLIHISLRATT